MEVKLRKTACTCSPPPVVFADPLAIALGTFPGAITCKPRLTGKRGPPGTAPLVWGCWLRSRRKYSLRADAVNQRQCRRVDVKWLGAAGDAGDQVAKGQLDRVGGHGGVVGATVIGRHGGSGLGLAPIGSGGFAFIGDAVAGVDGDRLAGLFFPDRMRVPEHGSIGDVRPFRPEIFSKIPEGESGA
jgi:hypothetical protein